MEVLTAWKDAVGFVPITTADVIRQATDAGNYASGNQGANLALKDALEAIMTKGELKARPLGIWLSQQVDRVTDGLALRRLRAAQGSMLWRLEKH